MNNFVRTGVMIGSSTYYASVSGAPPVSGGAVPNLTGRSAPQTRHVTPLWVLLRMLLPRYGQLPKALWPSRFVAIFRNYALGKVTYVAGNGKYGRNSSEARSTKQELNNDGCRNA